MRKRADWMNTACDPVLELLADSDLALPPGAIAYNLEQRMGTAPLRSTITRAIDVLAEYGLIQQAPGSKTYYEITDNGRQYLAGELDASTLEPTDN